MMKNKKPDSLALICFILGCLLVLSSLGYILIGVFDSSGHSADNEKILQALSERFTETFASYPEERGNNMMPSLQIEGENIAAILEFPRRSARYPVRSDYTAAAVKGIPCIYSGSIYDRSIIIGSSSSGGQLDFASEISAGETVCLTDMEGDRYTYTVEAVKHSGSFYVEKWKKTESDLLIFIHDDLSGDFTLIYCKAD